MRQVESVVPQSGISRYQANVGNAVVNSRNLLPNFYDEKGNALKNVLIRCSMISTLFLLASGGLAHTSIVNSSGIIITAGVQNFRPSSQVSRPAQRPVVAGGLPRVSPRGKEIFFFSNRAGNGSLYLMNVDGSNVRRLTPPEQNVNTGAWSPDGKQVVYANLNKDAPGLYVIDVGGENVRRLTETVGDNSPTWSPDRKTIAFISGKFPDLDVYTIKPDGSERQKLAVGVGFKIGPIWSPDGKRMAFVWMRSQEVGPKIYVINSDGSNPLQISSGVGAHEQPTWSPDGKWIAFQSSVRGSHHADVVIVRSDGKNQRELTTHTENVLYESPSWFPDGKRLAIQSDRTGSMGVYVINLSGKILKQLI